MELVEVSVARSSLIATLNAMREWLDHRRCETCSFRQMLVASGLVLQIGFASMPDANAFANRFAGQLMHAAGADADQSFRPWERR